MVDANEKEPRSIRLQGLSECQRERGTEREMGRGKAVTEAEETGEDGGLKNMEDSNILSTAGLTSEEAVIFTTCVCQSFGSTQCRG